MNFLVSKRNLIFFLVQLPVQSAPAFFDFYYILYLHDCSEKSKKAGADCTGSCTKKKMRFLLETRKFMVYSKLWIQRTMSWIAVVNSGMILFLVLSKLQDYGVKIYITAWFIPIYLGIIILMVFFGYLEDKAGLFREESSAVGFRNPHLREIIERLERIETDIKKIKR